MRSTTPSRRRLRSRPPRHRPLDALAQVVDEATAADPGHVLVHLAGESDEHVDVGLKSVDTDSHPFTILAGFEAPAEWWGFGVRVRGKARFLDDPDRPPARIATTYLVDRRGAEASLLRAGDEVSPVPGPAVGTIPDLCRRVLALPTDPAPPDTRVLWTTLWLDRLLAAWGDPATRREVSSSFDALAGLHPAFDAETADRSPERLAERGRAHADAWPWARLRAEPARVPLPDGDLPVDIAAWMDDGFYARWTLGAFPSPATMASDLRALLGDPLGRRLLETVVDLLR